MKKIYLTTSILQREARVLYVRNGYALEHEWFERAYLLQLYKYVKTVA
jgi:hypothetical protein